MKVELKYGHHNGERFYYAGEVMECSEKTGQSLIRQGLAKAAESKTVSVREQEQESENVQENAVPAAEEQTTEETPAEGNV